MASILSPIPKELVIKAQAVHLEDGFIVTELNALVLVLEQKLFVLPTLLSGGLQLSILSGYLLTGLAQVLFQLFFLSFLRTSTWPDKISF